VSLVDHSLLKLCQDGDVGTLSRYLALHHDKVPGPSTPSLQLEKLKKKCNNQCIILCHLWLYARFTNQFRWRRSIWICCPNFWSPLIAISGSIIIASAFEFRHPAGLSLLLEQHDGRKHPSTAFGYSEDRLHQARKRTPARNETEPQSATVKKFHSILNLKFNLNGKEVWKEEKIINVL
jgi:hypothetical protein